MHLRLTAIILLISFILLLPCAFAAPPEMLFVGSDMNGDYYSFIPGSVKVSGSYIVFQDCTEYKNPVDSKKYQVTTIEIDPVAKTIRPRVIRYYDQNWKELQATEIHLTSGCPYLPAHRLPESLRQ